jgi:hypothetical protein
MKKHSANVYQNNNEALSMKIKKISLVFLLLITSIVSAKQKIVSDFQARLDAFNQEILKNSQAWSQAKQSCTELNNCDVHEEFLRIDAQQKIILKKTYLINCTMLLHDEATKLGIENLFNQQRIIKKIIKK